MIRRLSLVLGCLVATGLVWSSSAIAAPQTLYSCGPGAGTGDGTDRGFYVTGYPGPNLHTVTLPYEDNDMPGPHTIELIAHLGAYDGPVLGSASTTANLASSMTPLTFTYSDPAVPAGSTVAFVQQVLSMPVGGFTLFDYTNGTCPGVIETEGTDPPLDSPRSGGRGVAVTITAEVPAVIGPVQYPKKKKCKKHKRGKKASAARKCKRHKHRAT